MAVPPDQRLVSDSADKKGQVRRGARRQLLIHGLAVTFVSQLAIVALFWRRLVTPGITHIAVEALPTPKGGSDCDDDTLEWMGPVAGLVRARIPSNHVFVTTGRSLGKRWAVSQKAAVSDCLDQTACDGLCHHPRDWTFFYEGIDQNTPTRKALPLGRKPPGWTCYHRDYSNFSRYGCSARCIPPCSALASMTSPADYSVLAVTRALQALGHNVDILVDHNEECQQSCVLSSAVAHGITIDASRLQVCHKSFRALRELDPLQLGSQTYSTFLLVGGTTPTVPGLGGISVHMPREVANANKSGVSFLADYDAVVFDSHSAWQRWETQVRPTAARLLQKRLPVPLRLVLPVYTAIFDVAYQNLIHRGHMTRFWRVVRISASRRTVRVAPVHASPYVAAIVETRVDVIVPLVIRTTMLMLPCTWRLNVFHGTTNREFMQDALRDMENAQLTQLDVDHLDATGYSRLLKSTWFWNHLSAQSVLIFQADSLLLRPGAHEFANYAYVGAPWHPDNVVYRGVLANSTKIPPLHRNITVGNGGLSMRSTEAMLAILNLQNVRTTLAGDVDPEDVFFARHLASAGYKAASTEEAAAFAQEVPHPNYTRVEPVGIHRIWKYTDDRRATYFLRTLIRSLREPQKDIGGDHCQQLDANEARHEQRP